MHTMWAFKDWGWPDEPTRGDFIAYNSRTVAVLGVEYAPGACLDIVAGSSENMPQWYDSPRGYWEQLAINQVDDKAENRHAEMTAVRHALDRDFRWREYQPDTPYSPVAMGVSRNICDGSRTFNCQKDISTYTDSATWPEWASRDTIGRMTADQQGWIWDLLDLDVGVGGASG